MYCTSIKLASLVWVKLQQHLIVHCHNVTPEVSRNNVAATTIPHWLPTSGKISFQGIELKNFLENGFFLYHLKRNIL